MTRQLLAVLVVAVWVLPVQPNVSQADSPKHMKLNGETLQLNGSGYRKKSLLSLYECGLYLKQPHRDAAAIINADQPMAIRIRIHSGFVSQSKMVSALSEGFKNSTSGQAASIDAQIDQFQTCFEDAINKNDVFVLAYFPGAGVVVVKNGQQKGIIRGLEFKQALFGIWLSDRPADASLKNKMLGR